MWQTDGRTDILPRYSPRYAYASRNKNVSWHVFGAKHCWSVPKMIQINGDVLKMWQRHSGLLVWLRLCVIQGVHFVKIVLLLQKYLHINGSDALKWALKGITVSRLSCNFGCQYAHNVQYKFQTIYNTIPAKKYKWNSSFSLTVGIYSVIISDMTMFLGNFKSAHPPLHNSSFESRFRFVFPYAIFPFLITVNNSSNNRIQNNYHTSAWKFSCTLYVIFPLSPTTLANWP